MPDAHARILAALELQEPDRVPTLAIMNEYSTINTILGKRPSPLGFFFKNPFAAKLLDAVFPLMNKFDVLSTLTIEREMERFAYDIAASAVKMDYDAVWVSYAPVFRFLDSAHAEDFFGRTYDVVMDGCGNVAAPMYRGGTIKSPADWYALDKKAILRFPEKANRFYSSVSRDFADRIFLFGLYGFGLFEHLWQPMGFERFAVAVRKEREFMQRVVRFYTDLDCMMLEALADAGMPALVYANDLAYRSGPMVNPRVLDELLGDAYRRITETAKELGMKIILHSCGNIGSLLSWVADCGFQGVHPLEPTAGMDLSEAKRSIGDRLCIVGNLDITHVLVDASRDEVFETVREAIRDAGPGGGYILAPNHSHSGISVERLQWMLDAAEQYGAYPLRFTG